MILPRSGRIFEQARLNDDRGLVLDFLPIEAIGKEKEALSGNASWL